MAPSDQEKDVVEDVVAAVHEALGRHGIMATRVMVLAETLEPEGDVAMWSAVDGGSKPWHTLGMLWCAIQQEQAAMTNVQED
jgi:hypothetical protein